MRENKINYPDVLGYIAKNNRKSFDLIECAVSTRPDVIKAGAQFESVLLIQNMTDHPVDVQVKLDIPSQDIKKNRDPFVTKSNKLLIGLQPAEVGYAKIPITCSITCAPHGAYDISMSIQTKPIRNYELVRSNTERKHFNPADVSNDKIAEDIQSLTEISFSSDDRRKRNRLFDTFGVEAPTGPASLGSLKNQAGWVSLWTIQDYLDEHALIKRVENELDILLPELTRETIFRPLLEKLQGTFEKVRFKLHVAEAIYITKLVTLVVEIGATAVQERRADKVPTWIQSISRLLMQEPRFATKPLYLLMDHSFSALLYDSIIHAFSMVSTVMNESYGTEEEIDHYAGHIVQQIEMTGNVNFGEVYLPLVCAGVIANTRVTMPRENVRDTLQMLLRVVEQRKTEFQTADNEFVFEIVESLIERGIEHF